jgi:hypothetical protein
LCEKKCDCKQCVTLPLETILELSDLGVATTDEVSDSDSDSNTISYIYQSASDTDDALLDLGFHKKPSYVQDVKKVASQPIKIDAFNETSGRTLVCREIVSSRNPFESCYTNVPTLIHRHKPILPFED